MLVIDSWLVYEHSLLYLSVAGFGALSMTCRQVPCVIYGVPHVIYREQQIMASFHIKQPPRNVISWISLLATSSTQPTASPKPLRPMSLETGIGGSHHSNIQASQKNAWGGFHKIRRQSSYHHSPLQCKETNSAQLGKKYSSTELSSPPYCMYLHPSERTFGTT